MATYNAKKLTITKNGDTYIIDPLQGNEAVYIDLPVTIHTSDWSGTAPYTYVYTNSHITAISAISVGYKEGIRDGLVGDLKFTKATGSVTFTTDEPPVGDIPVLIRVIDSATNGTFPIDASLVETDAIVGETTVQGALEDLDDRVSSAFSEIDSKPSVSEVVNTIYPVGSIYMSVNNTSPSTLFTGTTWEQIKDKFLLSAGDTYSAGTTGGNATVTLTIDQIPSHTHSFTPAGTINEVNAAHSHGLNSHTHTYSKTNTPTNSGTAVIGGTAITTAQLASHSHEINLAKKADSGAAQYRACPKSMSETTISSDTSGSGNTHTHTDSGHTHGLGYTSTNSGAATGNTASGNATHSHTFTGTAGTTGAKGGNAQSVTQAHDNMPPYLAVYIWKRTA